MPLPPVLPAWLALLGLRELAAAARGIRSKLEVRECRAERLGPPWKLAPPWCRRTELRQAVNEKVEPNPGSLSSVISPSIKCTSLAGPEAHAHSSHTQGTHTTAVSPQQTDLPPHSLRSLSQGWLADGRGPVAPTGTGLRSSFPISEEPEPRMVACGHDRHRLTLFLTRQWLMPHL